MKSLSEMSVREIEEALAGIPSAELLRLCQEDQRQGVQRLLARYWKQQKARAAEQTRIQGLLAEERKLWEKGYLLVAGIDEAGRGPLAGPVVAACCILPAKFSLPGLNDSKKLTESKRAKLFVEIQEQAVDYAIASAEPAEIDALNILEATRLAMKRAVEGLKTRPHHLLIDAVALPRVELPQTPIIGGDGLSASIAAASILAKVTRDDWMRKLHSVYPDYGFDQNKGYGTAKHMQALRTFGPCPLHRQSFMPDRAVSHANY